MLTITHSLADGTLIVDAGLVAGTARILTGRRFRRNPTTGVWYLPHTRHSAPDTIEILALADALTDAGIDVDVDIDAAYRPTVAADLIAHAGSVLRREPTSGGIR